MLLPPRKGYFVTRHGARMIIHPRNLDVFVTMRRAGNSWDYEDFQICYDLVLDGETFYDIGANIGYFTVEMLQLSGCKVGVVSFEPFAELADGILLSAQLNGHSNLTVFNAMVGDRSEQADFYLAPSSIHASAVSDSGRPALSKIPKPMVAIDDLVQARAAAPPDVVKADIEGSEHLLFAGACRVFRDRSPHIFVEYLADSDPGLRIRRNIEGLADDVPSYQIYGYPKSNLRHQFPHKLFPIKRSDDWNLVHGVVMRNADRAVRDEAMFGAQKAPLS
jgi:FkbM family methyltransferase